MNVRAALLDQIQALLDPLSYFQLQSSISLWKTSRWDVKAMSLPLLRINHFCSMMCCLWINNYCGLPTLINLYSICTIPLYRTKTCPVPGAPSGGPPLKHPQVWERLDQEEAFWQGCPDSFLSEIRAFPCEKWLGAENEVTWFWAIIKNGGEQAAGC